MARPVVFDIQPVQLHQRAAEILGMQKKHFFAMGAAFRLAVAEDARTRALQPIADRPDVIDFIADVVHAAVGPAGQTLPCLLLLSVPPPYRRLRSDSFLVASNVRTNGSAT